MFGEGDSATFKINLDTMAKYNNNEPKPEAFKNDKYMTFTVKIEKVFKKNAGEADSTFQKRGGEFFQNDYKATMDKIKNGEEAKIKTYIDDNKLKTSKTASGLNYVITAPGNSERATINDTVEVKYTGRLTKKDKKGNYRLFDTSDEKLAKAEDNFKQGKPYGPVKMAMNGVVPGFTEGLQLIGKGGKVTLVIPSKLGWGEQGAPQGGIGPYAPVVFDVEILQIIKGNPAAAVPAPPVMMNPTNR